MKNTIATLCILLVYLITTAQTTLQPLSNNAIPELAAYTARSPFKLPNITTPRFPDRSFNACGAVSEGLLPAGNRLFVKAEGKSNDIKIKSSGISQPAAAVSLGQGVDKNAVIFE